MELSRYVVKPLRKDENHILYRGRSQYDASQILVLSPLTEKDGRRLSVMIGGAMFEGSKNEEVAFFFDLSRGAVFQFTLPLSQEKMS
jgi:hypothetical protein